MRGSGGRVRKGGGGGGRGGRGGREGVTVGLEAEMEKEEGREGDEGW